MTPLERALQSVLTEREPHVSTVDHPHAFASEAQKCSRQIAFRLLEVAGATEFSTTTLLAFDIGNRVHAHVQAAFRQVYPDFKDEIAWVLEPEQKVSGRADGLYTDDEGRKVVVEIKSMNPMAWAQAARRDMPHYEHALQAHLSAYVLGAQVIHLVYVNKAGKQDDSPVLEWVAEADLAMAEIELARLQQVVDLAETGVAPERWYDGDVIERPESKKWPCAYCAWREQCVQLGGGEVQLLNPKVAKRSSTAVHLVKANDGQLNGL